MQFHGNIHNAKVPLGTLRAKRQTKATRINGEEGAPFSALVWLSVSSSALPVELGRCDPLSEAPQGTQSVTCALGQKPDPHTNTSGFIGAWFTPVPLLRKLLASLEHYRCKRLTPN